MFNIGISPPPPVFIGFLRSEYYIIVKSVFSLLVRVILQLITFAACFYPERRICESPAASLFQ